MKLTKLFVPIILFLALQSQAYALDQSATISVTNILKTQNSWDGKPIVYPQGSAEVSGFLVVIAPGAETGWHSHPVNSFGVLIEGDLEIQLKNGETKRLKAGEALAEVVSTLHNGRNVGLVPVKLVVFYTGVVGQKLTAKEN